MTPETLFYTASTTKSFTAGAMSLIVDDDANYSSVHWDSPISQFLPGDFVMQDHWATEHLTIADALSHRTGLSRHDLAVSEDPKEQVQNLRNLPMTAEPRVTWQYCNLMYHVIGHLITVLTGQSLASFFKKNLWEPLEMNTTFLNMTDALEAVGQEGVAHGYWWNNSTQEYSQTNAMETPASIAAGGILSNVLDYAKWIRAMMNTAPPLSPSGHAWVTSPQALVSVLRTPAQLGPRWYGFGWDSTIYGGEQIIQHSGAVDGFVSMMVFIPEKKYGVVVFANAASPAMELTWRKVIDDFLKVPHEQRVDIPAL
jgi:CubicO group peptidase (beta-lactamase class C family)